MSAYRTPLPALLATTLEAAINRLLAMDEEAPQRLAALKGRQVKVELDGAGIDLYFVFSEFRVAVNLDAEGEPDTVISASPFALFAMALPDGEQSWGRPGSGVRISGDALLARDLERLFSRLDPDWEAQLSNWFGEVAGYQLASGARGAAEQFRATLATLEDMTADFLQRPASPVAQKEEIASFGKAVDTLRDATGRLEARLRLLRERRAAESPSGADSPPVRDETPAGDRK